MLIRNVIFLSCCALAYGQSNLMPSTFLGDTPYKYKPVHNLSTPLRIQRDIAMNISLDALLWPALDMSTAFFGNNLSQKLSILHQPLLMGYKRLIFDLYYDPLLADWQLCPSNTSACNYPWNMLLDSVNDYLLSTQISGASPLTNLVSLVFNLHSAENISTHLAPSLLSLYKSRLYTPYNLTVYRNASSDHHHSWPQWLDLIQKKVQLLLAFGSISPSVQVSDADKQVLFNQLGTISTTIVTSTPIAWSFISDTNTMFTYSTAFNATQYGYSPLFTHNNYSGDPSTLDPGHLADNLVSTLWSWDTNQPETQGGLHRCAAIKNNGRWAANDCAEALHVACRTSTHTWVVTDGVYNYDRSLSACPSNSVFEVPRIPGQNLQLHQAILAANISENVWLNLNLVYNQDACWAVGRYGTCWWTDEAGLEYLGLIQTSIVSGVIVLLLVGIFTWVRCARLWRNRNSKPRKAMVKAMLARREYVTVPA